MSEDRQPTVCFPRRRICRKPMAHCSTQPTAFRSWVEVLQTRHEYVRFIALLAELIPDDFNTATKQLRLEQYRSTSTVRSRGESQNSHTASLIVSPSSTQTQTMSSGSIKYTQTSWETDTSLMPTIPCSQRFGAKPPPRRSSTTHKQTSSESRVPRFLKPERFELPYTRSLRGLRKAPRSHG